MVIHDQTLIPPIQVLLSSYTYEMQIIAINDQYRLNNGWLIILTYDNGYAT